MNRGCVFRIICVSIIGIFLLPFYASAQEKLRIGLSSVSATSGRRLGCKEKGRFTRMVPTLRSLSSAAGVRES